jgi:hypothetical protein
MTNYKKNQVKFAESELEIFHKKISHSKVVKLYCDVAICSSGVLYYTYKI